MKLNDPVNSSKHAKFLAGTMEALLKGCNDPILTFETISSLYGETFDTKLSKKELNNEIMLICQFNRLTVSVQIIDGLPVLGIERFS